MTLKSALIALLGLAATAPAAWAQSAAQGQDKPPDPAQRPGDWYVSGFVGGTFLGGARNQGLDGNALSIQEANNPGYEIRGAFGAYRTPQVRVEGEITYRRADFSSASVTNDGGLGSAAGQGSLNGVRGSVRGASSALSFMANVSYDYDTGSPWHPYWTIGLGFARVGVDDMQIASAPIANGTDWVFAYQGGLGIGYELSPRTMLALDYRYFATLDPTFRDAAGGRFTSDFTSHNLSVGVRYRF